MEWVYMFWFAKNGADLITLVNFLRKRGKSSSEEYEKLKELERLREAYGVNVGRVIQVERSIICLIESVLIMLSAYFQGGFILYAAGIALLIRWLYLGQEVEFMTDRHEFIMNDSDYQGYEKYLKKNIDKEYISMEFAKIIVQIYFAVTALNVMNID